LRALRRKPKKTKGNWQPAWITSDIAVAAAPAERNLPDILAAGIYSIVDLREGQEPGYHLEGDNGDAIMRMNLPTPEGSAPTQEQLKQATAWIKARIEQHGPVLIHCREGRGRSALVACATLVRMGFTPEASFALARRNHPRMQLSDEQHQALDDFGRSWALLNRGL
jgi:hypothetical protein